MHTITIRMHEKNFKMKGEFNLIVYHIEMPKELMKVAEEPSFRWQLGEDFESNERYMEFGSVLFLGHVYEEVVFDFYDGIILIILYQKNFKAVNAVLQSLAICSESSLCFPLWANKKSSPL